MIREFLGATRDLGRLHEIGSVLIKHGFGDLVQRVGLASALEAAGRRLRAGHPSAHWRPTPAERLRRVLEELGPTFVKLGQILATRVDLLPADWIRELETLRDHVAPLPFVELRQRLVEELPAPPEDLFASIDPQPLGAGSLAQVHSAVTQDGVDVVLKIRRPGIAKRVAGDLRILRRIAELAEAEVDDAWRYRPVEVCRQLSESLNDELDFRREASHAERFARAFAENAEVVIPRIFDQWTTERLLVEERIAGVRGTELDAARAQGLDLVHAAKLGAHTALTMIFEHGFFHADPHGGNVFLLADGRLGLIDFGMVGRLSPRRRDEFVELLYSLVERDAEAAAELLVTWSAGLSSLRVPNPRSAIERFLDRYHGLSLAELDVPGMIGDFMALLRDYGLALPADLAMLAKVLLTLEGFGVELDPDFNVVAEMRPFLERILRERYSKRAILKRARRNLRRLADVASGLPSDLYTLLRLARAGRLQVHVDVPRLERFSRQIEASANRLTVGIVIAALIIGTAIATTVDSGPRILGMPLLGFLGFTSSFALGLGLLWSLHRSSRRPRF